MQFLKRRIVKATAVALVLTVTHLCMSAELVRAQAARLIASVAPQGAVQGRLTTRGNNPVTVNGNSATSGETIFSGQSIQTPDGVGATVNLPGLGRVDLAPNTNITLSFEAGKINVTLASGCVALTADRGTTGTLAEGDSTRQTDAAKGGTLDTCSKYPGGVAMAGAGGGAAPAATTAAATSGGLFGLGTAGTVGFIGSAAIMTAAAVIAPCRRGRNPSPGDPRGRNDECRD
jgi:hypothetical protein